MAPHFEMPGIGRIAGTEHDEGDEWAHDNAVWVIAAADESIVPELVEEVADDRGRPCNETSLPDDIIEAVAEPISTKSILDDSPRDIPLLPE